MLTISDRLVTLVLFTALAFTHLSDVEGQITKNAEGVVVHIGYQKFNTLNILKAKGTLDRRLASLGAKAEWHQFAAGPQLLEALNAGSLDFGHAADAPTAFGQAAGIPLVYVAAEPPYPKGLAIVVQKDSPIRTVADLKGKTVAVGKGWNCQYQIVAALEKAGLKYADIKPAYVTSAADARAAFESGRVDAIGIWDPFYAVLELESDPRVLCDGTGLTPNSGTYFRVPGFNLSEPSPQRTPVLYQAGASRRGKDFAARHAECVFVSGPSAGIVRNYVRDIRQRAAELGRAQILIFAMYTIIVAPTESEALAKLHEYRTYIDYEGALALMAGWTGVDLSKFELDEELRPANTNANQSALESFTTGNPNRRWKIRDIAEFVGLGGRGPVVVGSPSQVADLLQQWIEETDVDGFNVAYAVMPETYEDIISLLVPELQRRGVYKKEYRPGSLREKLFGQGPYLPETHPGRRFRDCRVTS